MFNLVTLFAALGMAAAVFFTVVPVLPGSIIGLLALLGWAVAENNPVGWTVFAICGLLMAAGASMQLILTGRTMRRKRIPSMSVIVGTLCGLVLMFFVPVVGLPLGFVLGLFIMEYLRLKDPRAAASSSWAAIKATGYGILAEFSLAATAATVFFAVVVFAESV